jgi:hypothetical protein
LIGYHPGHPFSEDGGQLTIPSISGNYNCRQAGVLIVADQATFINDSTWEVSVWANISTPASPPVP